MFPSCTQLFQQKNLQAFRSSASSNRSSAHRLPRRALSHSHSTARCHCHCGAPCGTPSRLARVSFFTFNVFGSCCLYHGSLLSPHEWHVPRCAGSVDEVCRALGVISMLCTTRTALRLSSVQVRGVNVDLNDDDAAAWESAIPPWASWLHTSLYAMCENRPVEHDFVR